MADRDIGLCVAFACSGMFFEGGAHIPKFLLFFFRQQSISLVYEHSRVVLHTNQCQEKAENRKEVILGH